MTAGDPASIRHPHMSELPVPRLTTDGQPIPHNREAEEAVLGSVLVNAEVYYDP